MNRNYFQPHIIFLIIALIYGTSFLFITPPFQVPDEPAHFLKAFYLSEGHILPGKDNYYFPGDLKNAINPCSYLNFHPKNKIRVENSSLLLNQPNQDKIFINISNIAIYPPIPYSASAFIITIGKLFNVSYLVLMYSGRLINLLIWAVLVYFAIKITPIHKWIFLMLALMPMALFQAASLSADSFTIGLSFLVVAIFFKFAFDDTIDKIKMKELLIIFISIFMLSLSKQGYAVLLLLFFIIPLNKFENNKIRILAFALIGSITLAFTSIWDLLFKNTYLATSASLISVSGQISFILSNPFNFLYILVNTWYLNLNAYLIMFVGDLGQLDTPLPGWIVYLYISILILVALMDKNKPIIRLNQKLISLVTFLIISIFTFAFEYITWTPVGNNLILGVQGRYFIPIAPLLFLLFYNQKFNINLHNKKINFKLRNSIKLAITIFIILFLFITVLILISRYYT